MEAVYSAPIPIIMTQHANFAGLAGKETALDTASYSFDVVAQIGQGSGLLVAGRVALVRQQADN
jgi:hypothetical protein